MSLPDGVTTCLLTYGPITDTFGNLADSISVEVVADRTIVHAASGRTLFKNPVVVTADGGGVAQLPVPFTDQAGFRDQQQNSLTGWYYTVRLSARFGNGIQTDVKTFQPLVGQTTVDADLLPSSGVVTPGVTAPTAVVTSVAGFTGEVTAEDLAGVVGPFDSGLLSRSLDVEPGKAAVLNYRRIGSRVDYFFSTSSEATYFAAVFPEGFRPSSGIANAALATDSGTGALFTATVYTDGSGDLEYSGGTTLSGGGAAVSGSFITDDAVPS